MRKALTSLVAILALVGWWSGGIRLPAQEVSQGGAWLPIEDQVVGGQWTFKRASNPLVFEGATDDASETTITFNDPTADVTATVPDGGNASFAFVISSLTTNEVDVANSVWAVSNGIRFEGATADAFELTLSPADVGADVTVTLPAGGGAAWAFVPSALTTNDVDVVNSIWGVSNGLRFEGATADAFETTLAPTNVGADITLTLPGMGNAAGALLGSTLATNDVDVVNSIWGASNGLVFEGATANAFETTLSPTNVGADVTLTLPGLGDVAGALLGSTLTTNDVDAANSVWFASNAMVWEGATANTEEVTFQVADVTADLTINWRNDPAGTYHPLTQITGDVTTGYWQTINWGSSDVDMTMADNTLYVYRLYLPNWLTIANAYIRGTQGGDIAGADDTLAVAIYEDADAGAQLTEALSADFAATGDATVDVTDVTLGPGFYRVAVCTQDASGIQFVAETLDDEFIDVANQGTVTIGTGANACVAGDPPATTGAITTADINMPLIKFAS